MNRYFAARGWVLAGLFAALIAARAASEAPLHPGWLILVLAGIALRGWAGAHLGEHGNAARAEAPALATEGPYRLSRNPLYLSNILVAAGLIFYANAFAATGTVVLLLLVAVHHALLVRHEERVLAAKFGMEYTTYFRDVSRWVGISNHKRNEVGVGGVSLRNMLTRQGRNTVYALTCVLLVWVAARWF